MSDKLFEQCMDALDANYCVTTREVGITGTFASTPHFQVLFANLTLVDALSLAFRVDSSYASGNTFAAHMSTPHQRYTTDGTFLTE